MKTTFFTILLTLLFLVNGRSQTTNDILNILIGNKVISQEQADSLRADAAIKQQDEDTKKKSFMVTAIKSLQIGGYGQMRYQYLEEKGKGDGFDIRRAYVDLKSKINPYWSLRLQADFAGTPKIVDLYTELKFNDYINFTFGQTLIPFSLENNTSNTKLDLADRSQVVEALVARKNDVINDHNGRDLGIQVGGSFIKVNGNYIIDYRLGIFNGDTIKSGIVDQNDAKDFAGRLIIHPFKGLNVGASYYNGWTSNLTKDTTTNGARTRIGAELSYEYKLFSIKSEYIQGTDGSIDRKGWYAQGSVFIWPKKMQLVYRYDTYDKNTSAKKKDDITTNHSLGLNYFINSNALLQVAYTIKEEQGKNKKDNNTGTVQLQISF